VGNVKGIPCTKQSVHPSLWLHVSDMNDRHTVVKRRCRDSHEIFSWLLFGSDRLKNSNEPTVLSRTRELHNWILLIIIASTGSSIHNFDITTPITTAEIKTVTVGVLPASKCTMHCRIVCGNPSEDEKHTSGITQRGICWVSICVCRLHLG
jgi:hypothetical protein